MSDGSVALFLQLEQKLDHEYCSVNCSPERKMDIGNYILIATVIETNTLITHVLLQRCLYEDKTKQTVSYDWGSGGSLQAAYR